MKTSSIFPFFPLFFLISFFTISCTKSDSEELDDPQNVNEHHYSNDNSFISCPNSNHPHMIDLGLPSRTKWACCNVGASKPDDYGDFYAWGETKVKSRYEWNTYLFGNSRAKVFSIGSDIAGTNYDVADKEWGKPWHIPTKEQLDELVNNCTISLGTENGVKGRLFKGSNGHTIFFPFSGGYNYSDKYGEGIVCSIWSSTQGSDLDWAYCLTMGIGDVNNKVTSAVSTVGNYRYIAHNIRPVRE